MTREFPQTFAVVKAQANPRSFQILMSSSQYNQEEGHDVYTLENASWARDLERTRYEEDLFTELDPCVYTFCYYSSSHSMRIRKFKYWYTPYSFTRNGQRIPILEFQYKSWLPSGGIRIPIAYNETHFMDTLNTINQERCADIHNAEQGNLVTPPPRTRQNRSPPPISRQSPHFPESVEQTRRRLNMLDDYHPQPPPPQQPLPPSLLELLSEESSFAIPLPVAFQVTNTAPPGGEAPPSQQVLPLPKHVGDLLIHHSRLGTESCPILATPFSECDTLTVTSCFHVFDSQSLGRWRTDHSTCPVCRTPITNVVEES